MGFYIATQVRQALVHRDATVYDHNFHGVELVAGSRLASLYPEAARVTVNSIHHQAIKELAPGFEVEAFSFKDGLVEAIRRTDLSRSYLAAVQWHPEFHLPGTETLDDAALLQDFLDAAAAAKTRPA